MCSWLHNRERHSRRRKLHLFPRLYISTGSQSLRQQDLLFKVRSSLPWLLSRFFLSFFLFKTKINRQQRQTRKRSLTLSLSLWWRKSLRRFITTNTMRTLKNPNLQNSGVFFFFLRKGNWLLRSLMFTSYKYKHIFLQGGKKYIYKYSPPPPPAFFWRRNGSTHQKGRHPPSLLMMRFTVGASVTRSSLARQLTRKFVSTAHLLCSSLPSSGGIYILP